MEVTVSNLVLVAKQHEIEELRRLADKSQFVTAIGQLVHALQKERGATSIFLASQGERFGATRQELVTESQAVERRLRDSFAGQLQGPASTARLLSLMAAALLALDGLPALRTRIDAGGLPAHDAAQSFSQIIERLLALIFEVADAALDPGISRLLVALFNLVQGKELAGQERALGGQCFASGRCDADHQERLNHLIDAQERSFQLFAEFADEALVAQWNEQQAQPVVAQLERLRRVLYAARPGAALDVALNDKWFEACSERLAGVWSLQCALVDSLQARCATLIAEAERSLLDVEGLLQRLREQPPTGNEPGASSGQSLGQVLQAQSERLASMQADLETAKRALNERKLIERAKGILMERFQINEDAAHVMLRKASMDQNRRLVDVAEAALSLPAFLVPPRAR